MKRQLSNILSFSLAVTFSIISGVLAAATPQISIQPQSVKQIHKTAPVNNMTKVITTEVGEIEIVTDLSGKHYWQLKVTNTSQNDARNFQVIVTAEGFRKEDKVQTVGVIELLKAGRTAYARAELPNFEGMHRMRVKAGGTAKVVEIPRPFRKDAKGSPVSALGFENAWVRTLNDNIRWYLKTKPNLYDTIKPNHAHIAVYLRVRKHKYCHQESFSRQNRISYIDPKSPVGGLVTNPKPIRPGEVITLSGEFNENTAKPNMPKYVDQLIIEAVTFNEKKVISLENAYMPDSWQLCD